MSAMAPGGSPNGLGDIVLYTRGRDWFDADECLLMFFVDGVREIADLMGG